MTRAQAIMIQNPTRGWKISRNIPTPQWCAPYNQAFGCGHAPHVLGVGSFCPRLRRNYLVDRGSYYAQSRHIPYTGTE